MTAMVEGHRIAIGNERFLETLELTVGPARAERERLEENGATVIHVAMDGTLAGLLAISDQIRPEAARTVERLKAMGTLCF